MNVLACAPLFLYNICKPFIDYVEDQYLKFTKKNEEIHCQSYLENSKKKLLKRYNVFYNKSIHFLGCMSLGFSMLIYTLARNLIVHPFECLSIHLSSKLFSKLKNNNILEDNFTVSQYTFNNNIYSILCPKNYIPKIVEIYVKRKESDQLIKDETCFRRFIGPNENFHGLKLTPKMLGFYEVYIYYEENRTIPQIFKENDILTIA